MYMAWGGELPPDKGGGPGSLDPMLSSVWIRTRLHARESTLGAAACVHGHGHVCIYIYI